MCDCENGEKRENQSDLEKSSLGDCLKSTCVNAQFTSPLIEED